MRWKGTNGKGAARASRGRDDHRPLLVQVATRRGTTNVMKVAITGEGEVAVACYGRRKRMNQLELG